MVIGYCELDIGHLGIWSNAMIYLNDDRQTEANFIESAIYEQYHFLQIQLMRMLELLVVTSFTYRLDLTILKLIAEPSKIF